MGTTVQGRLLLMHNTPTASLFLLSHPISNVGCDNF